jgi:hypothetical protein
VHQPAAVESAGTRYRLFCSGAPRGAPEQVGPAAAQPRPAPLQAVVSKTMMGRDRRRREVAMFVQVIEGRVADRDALRRQVDRWLREVRPGATGFLGSTGGVTDDGYAITFARFESAPAAKANSERPEQGEWWAETEKCFGGDVTFTDSEDVETLLGGGSDDAGFVQVMKGTATDRARLKAMDEQFVQHAASFRPDFIGGLRVWTGPDRYVEAAYFTSEAAAREGEKKEPPAELAAQMGEFEDLMSNVEFLDLRDPWFH